MITEPALTLSGLWNRSFVLLCLSMVFFFAAADLLAPIVPVYLTDLALQGQVAGTLIASFMVASLLMRPWAGKLCDETGKKRLMLLGLSIFALCPLLYLIPIPGILQGVRLLHGASFALFYTASYSALADILPPHRKAEGIGYFSNAIKIAMAFSPGIALGLLHLGWVKPAFVFSTGFALLALACVLGIRLRPPEHLQAATTQVPGKLFNRAAFLPGLIMTTNSMAFGALIPFIPMYAAEKHLTTAGWFYTLYAIFLIFSRGLTGPLSDRYGRNAVLIPGMAMVIVTVWALSLSTGDAVFLAAAALYGLSAGTVQPSLMAVALDQTRPHERGSSMATFSMMNDLGIALGSYLVGAFGSRYGYGPMLLWVVASATAGWGLYLVSQKRLLMTQPTEMIPNA